MSTPLQIEDGKVFEYLARRAAYGRSQARVTFFGCSRCRYSRKGCINWFCNPEKFKAHHEKCPEKYQREGPDGPIGRQLHMKIEWAMTPMELLCGDHAE